MRRSTEAARPRSFRLQYIGGAVLPPDAVNQEDIPLGVFRAQGEDRLICRRKIPGAGGSSVGKADYDQVAPKGAFQHLLLAPVDDEASMEGREGGVDFFPDRPGCPIPY